MSTRSERYAFSLAGPEDGAALLRILESSDFQGGISVCYTRRPDPLASYGCEGDAAMVPVMRDLDSGEIIAMGGCVVRKAFINGEIRNVGYLTGLKVLPAYRNRVPHIAKVYEFLHHVTEGRVDLYYTTILQDNFDAQRILEKKRRGMPEYRFCGLYTVYCFRTGRRARGDGLRLETGYSQELGRFFQERMGAMHFSPTELSMKGIGEQDIYTLRTPDGEILAACAVWNQQPFKQHIVTGYSGIYGVLKHLPLGLLGYPEFPRAGFPANHAAITGLCVRGNDVAAAGSLIRKVAEARTDVAMLLLGLFENHPMTAVFRHIPTVTYQSRLYTVHWPGEDLRLDDRPINLEVGLL